MDLDGVPSSQFGWAQWWLLRYYASESVDSIPPSLYNKITESEMLRIFKNERWMRVKNVTHFMYLDFVGRDALKSTTFSTKQIWEDHASMPAEPCKSAQHLPSGGWGFLRHNLIREKKKKQSISRASLRGFCEPITFGRQNLTCFWVFLVRFDAVVPSLKAKDLSESMELPHTTTERLPGGHGGF